MDGLFVVIVIVIFIANFAARQQRQNQQHNKNRGGIKSQKPLPQWQGNPQQPDRTVRNMENRWDESMKDAADYVPAYDSEGIEIEERSRTGSMDYTEQSKSSEGMSYQSIKPEQKQRKEKKAVPRAEIIEEEPVFDLTEENLLRSIVMAEVLGPPRAMKRNIR